MVDIVKWTEAEGKRVGRHFKVSFNLKCPNIK